MRTYRKPISREKAQRAIAERARYMFRRLTPGEEQLLGVRNRAQIEREGALHYHALFR